MREKLIASLWLVVVNALVAGGCIMHSLIMFLANEPLPYMMPALGGLFAVLLGFWVVRAVRQIGEATSTS